MVLVITVISILIFIRLLVVYSGVIKFLLTGLDKGFKFSECFLLWRLSRLADLEEPIALFVSVPSLNRAIASVIRMSKMRGKDKSDSIQNFLSKLYDFRTKLNLEHENKKGLESTKYLGKGQRLRIIFPGHGVFTSEIVNNGYEIIIRLPSQNRTFPVLSNEWVNKKISVYLWRKGDASYVFDTKVTNSGVFNGQTVLYLAQTTELLRAQKRKSVRCECNLDASLYFINQEITDFNMVETEPGYKVVLEDISEDGAMIRVGGQGLVNAQIKIQFMLNDVLILMYGIVRAVEYNKSINQSRLHFECIHLEKDMKNAILSFVYNVLPQEQKEVFDALIATEEDKAEDDSAVIAEAQESPLLEKSEQQKNPDLEEGQKNSDDENDEIYIPLPQELPQELSKENLDKLAELAVN